MIGEESDCLSLLYIKLFELCLEVAFYNGSAVTHSKVDLLGAPISNFHVRAAAVSALIMLLCCSFVSASFTSRDPSSPSVDYSNSKMSYMICKPH